MCPRACLVLFDPIVGGGGGNNNKNNNNNNSQTAAPVSSRYGKFLEQHFLNEGVVTHQSSVLQTRSLEHQLDKLVEICGWTQAVGCDMWWAYHTIVTTAQRQRAKATEVVDDVQDWRLFMKHYCLVVACASEHGLDFCEPSRSLLGFDRNKCTVKTNKNARQQEAQDEPAAQEKEEPD
mmetsp:Transcript_2143/g.3382  ORF Transcript_2143/g.3382 Transcript_2143/m.3382 type:complete len:178 (+) Transcript_2143:1-534(+)